MQKGSACTSVLVVFVGIVKVVGRGSVLFGVGMGVVVAASFAFSSSGLGDGRAWGGAVGLVERRVGRCPERC